MGLIGGGGAGFIGKVHAIAGTLDRRAELVAGALSSNPERSKAAAVQFGLDPDRVYGSWQELLERESGRPREERIDFVSVATPNATHYEIASAALQAGFHVFCDKPMTIRVEDARSLAEVVRESGRIFALTHNYSGYPLVRQARQMIAEGELGEVIAVRSTYVQGWLNLLQVDAPHARGAWKLDPALSGSGTLGDVGTHAWHLVRYLTGFRPRDVSAVLRSFHPDRPLDDYGQITVRSDRDALCSITISQMSHGRLNDFWIEVDGTAGSLIWRQEHPNQLEVLKQGQCRRVYERDPNVDYLSGVARAACRIPSGHPEGFLEAFANLYGSAFDDIVAIESGQAPAASPAYPTVADGVDGVEFVDACLTSHMADGQWTLLGDSSIEGLDAAD